MTARILPPIRKETRRSCQRRGIERAKPIHLKRSENASPHEGDVPSLSSTLFYAPTQALWLSAGYGQRAAGRASGFFRIALTRCE